MEIIKWWTQHPEIVAIGQDNVGKQVSILARSNFDMEPLPEIWKDYQVVLTMENPNTIQQFSQNKPDNSDRAPSEFEEITF